MLKIFGLFCLVCCVAAEFNLYEILQGIPEHERVGFIKHHINKGRELAGTRIAKKENKEFDNYPEEFSMYLYSYAVNEHVIEDENRLKELRQIICFEDGTCIEVGDIGAHP